MSKPTLLWMPSPEMPNGEFNSETGCMIRPYFHNQIWQSGRTYDRHDILIIAAARKLSIETQDIIQRRRYTSCKTVVWHLFDHGVYEPTYRQDNVLYLRTPCYMWVQLSCKFSRAFKHLARSLEPKKHFCLLLMNQDWGHRLELFDRTRPYHGDSLITLYSRGVTLPDDQYLPWSKNQGRGNGNMYWVQPRWYHETHFSIVSESYLDSQYRGNPPEVVSEQDVFISEKIYKPLAFYHPLIVEGTPYILDFLHRQGFETWDHVIDERYDTVMAHGHRQACIDQQLEELYRDFKKSGQLFADNISQQRVEHNFHRFYDTMVLDQMFCKEFVDPIMEFRDSP